MKKGNGSPRTKISGVPMRRGIETWATGKKIRQHYNTRIRRSKESEKVTERRRRFNGAVGDNARNCVFLGSEANLQARSQDSTQDR